MLLNFSSLKLYIPFLILSYISCFFPILWCLVSLIIDDLHSHPLRSLGDFNSIFPKTDYTFPGEGEGDVEKIVKDLLQNDYDGGFSIEPHLAVVFHDDTMKAEDEVRYRNYVEYGRRFMKLVEKAQADLGSAQK